MEGTFTRATDRQGLINLSAAIQSDASRVEALAESICQLTFDPEPDAGHITRAYALADVIKLMSKRLVDAAAAIEASATLVPAQEV